MKSKSSALVLLSHVWTCGKKDSWSRINHSMFQALSLAIGSGLTFKASDFEAFSAKFRSHYWISESTEWIYSSAIVNGNDSCIEAYEEYCKRTPFRANDVSAGYISGGGYIHANSVKRQRERLAVGFSFPYDGKTWWVTRFDDRDGTMRAATYSDHNQSGKPKRLKVFSHEAITALFPAKKSKKPTPKE